MEHVGLCLQATGLLAEGYVQTLEMWAYIDTKLHSSGEVEKLGPGDCRPSIGYQATIFLLQFICTSVLPFLTAAAQRRSLRTSTTFQGSEGIQIKEGTINTVIEKNEVRMQRDSKSAGDSFGLSKTVFAVAL